MWKEITRVGVTRTWQGSEDLGSCLLKGGIQKTDVNAGSSISKLKVHLGNFQASEPDRLSALLGYKLRAFCFLGLPSCLLATHPGLLRFITCTYPCQYWKIVSLGCSCFESMWMLFFFFFNGRSYSTHYSVTSSVHAPHRWSNCPSSIRTLKTTVSIELSADGYV